MENKENNKGIESLTRNEWLEYIDKLIGREFVKQSRMGITIWIVLASMAFLLISIIDLVFSAKSLDVQIVLKLFYFYGVIVAFFYIIISVLLIYIKPNRGFATSFVDQRRNSLIGLLINIVSLVLIMIVNNTILIRIFYLILFLTLPEYVQINEPIYIHKDSKKYWISFMKVQLFKQKNKKYIIILLFLVCVTLLRIEISEIISTTFVKENILVSLYAFAFISLLFILIYQLIGNIEYKYLKHIETQIIFEEKINHSFIKEYFSFYIIGDDIYNWISRGFDEQDKTLDEIERCNSKINEAIKEFNIDDTDSINYDSLIIVYNEATKMMVSLKEVSIFYMNALSYAYQESSLKSISHKIFKLYKKNKKFRKGLSKKIRGMKKLIDKSKKLSNLAAFRLEQ